MRRSAFTVLALAAMLTGCGTAGPAPSPVAVSRPAAPVARTASTMQMAIQITVALRAFFPNDYLDVTQVSGCDGASGTYDFAATVGGSRTVHGTYYAAQKQVALSPGSINMRMAIEITNALRSFYPADNIDVDFVSSCTSNGTYGFSAAVGSRRVNGSYDVRSKRILL